MQKIQMICALFVLASVNIVAGQVIGSGRCPNNITTVQNLDLAKYMGTWYEYAKYPFGAEGFSRCNQAVYGSNSNNSFTVENSQVSGINNQTTVVHGKATIIDNGVISVRYDGVPSLISKLKFSILGTDYDNFSVAYGCTKLGLSHAETLWILTRERLPSEKVIKAAKDLLEANKISLARLTLTGQVDC